MPQETNLNVAPYFDDFDTNDNYCKILFKPGLPVQARELTGIQSIIQNQIEKFGNHVFKEGASVTGGGVRFSGGYSSVRVQIFNEGVDIESYLGDLVGEVVIGSESGVKAKITSYLGIPLEEDWYLLFVTYLNTGGEDNIVFSSGESLLLDNNVLKTSQTDLIFQPGQSVAQTVNEQCAFEGAAAVLSAGVYYVRGYFVDVPAQSIIINPYEWDVDAKIGLRITEDIVNSDLDQDLKDNAAGFSNYTAPGGDRLSITVTLKAIDPYDANKPSNFIELMEVRDGNIVSIAQDQDYNELAVELAARTYDESGNYYIKPYSLTTKNTLNDFEGNNGIFTKDQVTYNDNIPSEDLGTYKFSPGKAYIQGYEVETISPTFIDFEKPRTTKTLENQSINYVTGPTFTLNRVSGSPVIGIGTDYTVSLRSQRVGAAGTTAAGKEIGLARVYDFALESGSYNTSRPNENEWDISLYDIQTYTDLTLNTAATLTVPTHIKGKSSGATGYLRYSVSSGTAVTAYNTKGTFIPGEQFIFNGIESGNISAGSTSYSTNDIKSIHGTVSTASTFNADVKQTSLFHIGEVNISAATTSGAYLGISTVTLPDPTRYFVGIATVGNLVSYTNTNISGISTVSFARIESVSQHSLTISGVTTVAGICEGGLPTSQIYPSNFKVLSSQFQSSTDNNLYTKFPKEHIAQVDLTNSHITIRKQFDVTITNNSTETISSGSANETFLPYDEEDYILIRTDGSTESLSADKFDFNAGSTSLTINGLGTNDTAKLIATLRKVNVTSKIKERQKINVLNIFNSNDSSSGIGTTTLNDGLTYGTVYGTRVQDEEISLNVPDVVKVHAVFESKDTNNPALPKVTLSSINSSTGKTGDLLIGETFVGSDSNFRGIYVSKDDDSNINYITTNELDLNVGEIVTFEESGITATVSSLTIGSNNITQEFTYDDGQRNTIYDYSRLIRRSEFDAPFRKLSIIFESAYFTSSDTGDITTINSYNNFKYKDLPDINETGVSDIIDIRPRVSDFSGTSRSPFEFLGRSFDGSGNSAKNILASDGSILLDYSFYLPRFDKIYLNKDGDFQLVNGVPAETPEFPVPIDGALEVASVKLPPYLFNINDASIELANYKRYQMSDINKLEKRIENLEFYTSLTLLENDALNMNITDVDGLNRFKSGFFVDDFSNTDNQIKNTIVKNSIDYRNGELRPSPHTTLLDLKLDLDSANGIRKTGRALTLDYDDIEHIKQPFATRVENVTPYLVSYYGGTIDLLPDSDIWVDQVVLEAKHEDLTTYTNTSSQLSASEFDSRTGYSPVTWGAWTTNWTGEEVKESGKVTWWSGNTKYHRVSTTRQKTGTSTRKGTKKLVRETFSTINEGPKVINTQISAYMRQRNMRFDAKKLKPLTGVYAFFDGEDVNKYIIPKLIEISMVTGTFQVGETVIGTTSNGKQLIRFKVAQSNHKRGPIDDPSEVYKVNPYYQFTPLYQAGSSILTDAILLDTIVPSSSTNTSTEPSASSDLSTIPELYSSTSSILNIDMESLAEKSDNTFYGHIEKGLKLVGQTSNAQASVSNLRLKTDNVGGVIGSFFIPNPNDIANPKFETGKKSFRLTSNKFNSQVEGNVTTDAVKGFEATGNLETLQATIISVKNIATDTITRTENKAVKGQKTTSVNTQVIGRRNPPSPPRPPRPDPPGPGPCPTPDMTILMSDGSTKPAGELQVGDLVDTLHEDTLVRGNHKVTYVGIKQAPILELDFSGNKIKCSTSHKFYSNNEWVTSSNLVVGQKVSLLDGEVELTNSTQLGEGDVVKITVEDAHTYICEGFLSHNKTPDREPDKDEPPKTKVWTKPIAYGVGSYQVQQTGSGPIKQTGKFIDPIAAAYSDRKGNGHTLTEGAKKFWGATISNTLEKAGIKKGSTTWYAAAKNEMTKHLKFAEKVKAGKASVTKKAVEAGRKALVAKTGITSKNGYKKLNKPCGAGQPDPLAQSFYVSNSVGIYVTKVDLYFGAKDEYLPVSVQLRTMKSGVPTTEIIPFGEVVLDPDQVNVSDDATAVTTVTFPSPVFLSGSQSYAVVLLSVSNEYTAWISRMGEIDIQTKDNPESEQITVSSQPTLGSLFKSQNGETWNPSQYEDLKFTLYRAQFVEQTGSINFHNPPLLTYSETIAPLTGEAFSINSNKIRIGFNTTISDTGVTLGNTIQQYGSNASGNFVGTAGTANGNLTITNSGIGFTPSSGAWTYQDVSLNTITGYGRNATANITITNGVASAATIANGGSGYSVGDVVGITSVGINSLGRDIKFSIAAISGVNEYILDNVQGDFVTGVGKTIQYITSAGIVTLNHSVGGNVWLSGDPVTTTDGLHIKVNQKNHGMYSTENVVTLTDVSSDVIPTQLSADYDSTSTGSIIVNDGTEFASFENVGVGSTNLGYVKIGTEILSYSGVVNNTLTGVTRGVDSTQTLNHTELDFVHKYELNGVSLRRINTDHNISNATVSNSLGIDYYNIKVDMSTNGVDRSVGTSLPKLYFNETKSTGGYDIIPTENIPFEIVTPIVQNITPGGTTVSAQIRTITAASVDGSETPFVDKGFEDISIISDNFMSTPRMVASRINETTLLPNLPENRSFTMSLNLYGLDSSISPMVDLDRIGVILTSNRINNPIDDWITDNRVSTLKDDPNAFVYASKPVTLENGATSIKIHLEGHINVTSDLRALYAIAEGPEDELIYKPFPGYPNLLSSGQVIDPAKNSGLPDKALPKTDVIAYTSDQVVWKDYEFTIDNLPTFRYFSIKLVGTGTNQAQPPRVKNLRVIALA